MGDTWLKIKAWTKGILFALIALYVILFAYNNSGYYIHFWWWFGKSHDMSAFFLAFCAFLCGGVTFLLIATTWRTVRQLRDLRSGRRIEKLEREQAELRAKAAMLQSHQSPAAVATGEGTTVRVDSLGDPR